MLQTQVLKTKISETHMLKNKIIFDRELIEKCQINAPRYTSYPTADRFNFEFNLDTQNTQLCNVFNQTYNNDSVSLYIHIPFCNTLCLFCGCNKIITNNRQNITTYLEYLDREIKLYNKLINNKKLNVVQLHFGGGSPSWLSKDEINQVMHIIKQYFNLDNAKEIAMEIDPRHCDEGYIQNLQANGFNRISIGVQDFNPEVQKAVNRIQSYEESNNILEAARKYGIKSTNVDLIYGLPLQNLETFSSTIDKTIQMYPDRIALFNYAHIPALLMPQTRIKEDQLPSGAEKLDILQMSVEKLTNAGYVFIGMDHFALPSDDLAIALADGTIERNFQGYSTFADTNMLSFGVSSIGFIGNSYYQNVKDLQSYYLHINNGQLPILRGVTLTDDDIIRRFVIKQIMCKFCLNFSQIENKFNINFSQYFDLELLQLQELENLGLIDLFSDSVTVTPKGRFLIRNVAVVFDKYIRNIVGNARYSKVV
ncbi:MAG: oxygen-independent coproporphyrinogen III oxidase [Proteobacteria bacterium]|jgi:oxygen-independent coproporphyrinogen-3 oxidase|nr:oxygen-independent coproporphyrinogen III oxidase [Pseudomonadota bacterium]